jgi:NodT family efflux transporter outer membrane factor (OMF) lipoprotein
MSTSFPKSVRGGCAGAAVCAFLAGCAVGPDFHRPAAPTQTGYTREPLAPSTVSAPVAGGGAQRFSSSLDVSGRWWEGFESPEINRLVESALRANPDLQSAQAALRAARENLYAQRGALYPEVQAGFTASTQKNSVVLASPLADNANFFSLTTAQVTVSYAPDVFGGVRRQIETAAAQVDGQRYALEATYLTLTTNVVLAALQEASLRGQIQATERAIALGEQVLADLRRQKQWGQAAAGDVATQEAALAQTRAALPPLAKQLALQQDLLDQLTGGPVTGAPDAAITLDRLRLPADLPLSLPARLVAQRPDIRAAEANLHVASAQIGVAVANRLPSFPLNASFGGTSGRIGDLLAYQNTLWDLSAGVSQPIFEGGALRHRQRGAEAAFDQAAAQYRSTVHGALQNVADTLQGLDQDARALRVAAEARDAAAKSLAIARQELRAGEVNSISVLNAEQADQLAASTLVQAEGARYADTVALFQALGGGWWNRSDAEPAPKK